MNVESESRIRTFSARARQSVIRLGSSATTVAGILSLSGFLAAWAWPFELLCHFRVQYCVLFLTLCVLMAVLRSWRWARVGVVLAVVNGWELMPYYYDASDPESGSVASLRVVSANLFSGNREPETALKFLRESEADVIAVYEVTPAWERRLSDALPGYPYRHVEPQVGNFGIAVYSRLPLEAVEIHDSGVGNLAIQVAFAHAGTRVHLIAAHAFPPGGVRTELRNQQLRRLGELAVALTGPVIVVGDLNITPFSPGYRELCAAGHLSDARRGHGICASWPAGRGMLAIPIDHCLVRDCRAGFATGPDIGSDHLPLVIDLWEFDVRRE